MDRVLKIVLLGSSGVGKTSLVRYFITHRFDSDTSSTISVEFSSIRMVIDCEKLSEIFKGGSARKNPESISELNDYELYAKHSQYVTILKEDEEADGDNEVYDVQIWDTAGQEVYARLASTYYRGADLAIVVASVDVKDSIRTAVHWIEELYENCTSEVSIVLAVNKIDVPQDRWEVKIEDIKKVVDETGIMAISVSAKTGERVFDLFYGGILETVSVQEGLKGEPAREPRRNATVQSISLNNTNNEKEEESGGCC